MHKILKSIVILSVIGTLFAGAVTARQYIAPATTPGIFSCVGFKIWGFSPCPYGLAIFSLLSIISFIILRQTFISINALIILRVTSVGGVLFSGWVGYREMILPALARGATYWQQFDPLAIPACVWGFLVFLAVGILSFIFKPRVI